MYLIVLLILVGALALANLLLTVGVIRRLREHTTQLAQLAAPSSDTIALPVGSRVPDVVATSADGRAITAQTLSGRTLVGVFSPHCAACKERLPDFKRFVSNNPQDRDLVLAVVAGTIDDTAELTHELAPFADVVIEAEAGPVQQALSVTGYPAFLRLDNGVVTTSGYDLAAITGAEATHSSTSHQPSSVPTAG